MNRRRANTLIGLMVAMAIVILATLFFVTGGKMLGGKVEERPDGKGETMIGKSIYRAKDTQCRSNLGQMRQGIGIATDPVENTFPQSLEETRLGATFYKCPVGGEAYVYDPATGLVSCPHAGHEKY